MQGSPSPLAAISYYSMVNIVHRCNHVTTQSCHQKYETVFKPAQYQKCRDTFKKSCFYEYKKVPQQHNVEICNDNLKRDCDSEEGETVCSIEYVTGQLHSKLNQPDKI